METFIQVTESYFDEKTKENEIAKLLLKQEQNEVKKRDFQIGLLTSERDEALYNNSQLWAKLKRLEQLEKENGKLLAENKALKMETNKQVQIDKRVIELNNKNNLLCQRIQSVENKAKDWQNRALTLSRKYNDYSNAENTT